MARVVFVVETRDSLRRVFDPDPYGRIGWIGKAVAEVNRAAWDGASARVVEVRIEEDQ